MPSRNLAQGQTCPSGTPQAAVQDTPVVAWSHPFVEKPSEQSSQSPDAPTHSLETFLHIIGFTNSVNERREQIEIGSQEIACNYAPFQTGLYLPSLHDLGFAFHGEWVKLSDRVVGDWPRSVVACSSVRGRVCECHREAPLGSYAGYSSPFTCRARFSEFLPIFFDALATPSASVSPIPFLNAIRRGNVTAKSAFPNLSSRPQVSLVPPLEEFHRPSADVPCRYRVEAHVRTFLVELHHGAGIAYREVGAAHPNVSYSGPSPSSPAYGPSLTLVTLRHPIAQPKQVVRCFTRILSESALVFD